MLTLPMAVDLEQEILALLGAPETRARGHVTMGEVVDQLVVRGHEAEQIEATIWSMLQARRCLLYTSPSPRDGLLSRMPSSA